MTDLGDLIVLFYDEFLALTGNEEVASIMAAQVINDLIIINDLIKDDHVQDQNYYT